MRSDTETSLSQELLLQASWVRRLARGLLREDAAAEDLAQEVTLAAWKRRAQGGEVSGPWLVRVASNLARRAWRDADARARSEREAARAESVPGPDDGPYDHSVRLELQRVLAEELQRLPEPERGMLLRRYFDGWSAARIAREAGVPASTVRWRLQRGLAELRARLDRRQRGEGVSWRFALLPLARSPSLPWSFSNAGPALVGVAQGVLAMKLSLQLVGVLVLVLLGVSVLWWGPEMRSEAVEPQLSSTAPEPGPAPGPAPGEEPEPLVPLSEREPIALPATKPRTAEAAAEAAAVAAGIDGRCVDRDRVPVHGARVGERSGVSVTDPVTAALTGADGVFRLETQEEGARWVCLEAVGFGTRILEAVTHRSETTHLGDVVLLPGGIVRGHVQSSSGGPVAGATLTITGTQLGDDHESARRHGPPEDPRHLTATSALDGSFRIEGVAAGMVRVWASAPGMLHALSGAVEVPVHADSEEVELVLEPLARPDRIAGILLDPEGAPVPGASAGFMRHTGLGTSQGEFRIDAEGRFEFSAASGSTYDLLVADREERWLQIEVPGVKPGTMGLVLAFAESSWIDVSVRSRGNPVQEFALFTLETDGGGYASGHMSPESVAGGHERLRAATRPFAVHVDAPGFALAVQGPIEPDAVPATLTFELEPEPGVRGRVLSYGEPVRGARVSLHAWCTRERIEHGGYPALQAPYDEALSTSDAEGRFVLSPRRGGTFVVRAEAPELAPGELGPLELDPRTGTANLELVLTSGGAVEGRVRMPLGRSPAGVIVALNRGDAHPRTQRSDEQGRFRFEGLMPGAWRLARGTLEFVEGRGSTSHSARPPAEIEFNCQVVDGETTLQDLDLSDWEPCRIRGELHVNGAPASGWLLSAWPNEAFVGGEHPSTASDARGAFELEVEDAGPATLSFRPPAEATGRGQLSVTLEVVPGDNPWKGAFTLGSLEGTVAAPPGEGELLFFVASEGVVPGCFWPIQADSGGRFVLPYLPIGRGEIQHLDADFAASPVLELEIEPGRRTVVEVP
jgi:RNA polymerase sigma factor (sigma-70 family)